MTGRRFARTVVAMDEVGPRVPAVPDAAGSEPERRERTVDEEAPLRTCPNCGRKLTARSCKLVCGDPGCGYFLSCSDYL